MEVVSRKVADAEGELNSLIDRFRQDAFDSYAIIRHNIDQKFLEICSRLRELIDSTASKLRRSVHSALCDAAGGVQMLLISTPEDADKNLNSIAGHV